MTFKISHVKSFTNFTSDTRNNAVRQFAPFCGDEALKFNSTNNHVNFTVSPDISLVNFKRKWDEFEIDFYNIL